jgi:hypothetical protein
LDGAQFIHPLWVGQALATGSFWVGLKKSPFSKNKFKRVLQTYQNHFNAWNPFSSSLCIFGGPNTLMSSVSKSNAHNSITPSPMPSLVLM